MGNAPIDCRTYERRDRTGEPFGDYAATCRLFFSSMICLRCMGAMIAKAQTGNLYFGWRPEDQRAKTLRTAQACRVYNDDDDQKYCFSFFIFRRLASGSAPLLGSGSRRFCSARRGLSKKIGREPSGQVHMRVADVVGVSLSSRRSSCRSGPRNAGCSGARSPGGSVRKIARGSRSDQPGFQTDEPVPSEPFWRKIGRRGFFGCLAIRCWPQPQPAS